MTEPNKFKTILASDPELEAKHHVALEVHLSEAMKIYQCVDYFCRHVKTCSHRHEMRDIISLLRKAISKSDPDLVELLGESPPVLPQSPLTIVREVHHHHYHNRPRGPYAG